MPRKPKKMRADVLLAQRGLCPSRAVAQAQIMAGQVMSGDRKIEKAGTMLREDAPLRLKAQRRYVSRGGDKLAGALDDFAAHGLDVRGARALDIGASTGGFTDCLLSRGAAFVHAVDVGYGQLHEKLRQDARVDTRERTNARYLSADDFEAPIDLIVVDASFIGLGKLMDAITACLRPGGALVALIKPQFEAGREVVAKTKGVVRDPEVRAAAVAKALGAVTEGGLSIVADTPCRVHGPKGNVEHFVYAVAPERAAATERPAPSVAEE